MSIPIVVGCLFISEFGTLARLRRNPILKCILSASKPQRLIMFMIVSNALVLAGLYLAITGAKSILALGDNAINSDISMLGELVGDTIVVLQFIAL